jgi:hypothetical protein
VNSGGHDRRFDMHRSRGDVAILFIVRHPPNRRLITGDPGIFEVGAQSFSK